MSTVCEQGERGEDASRARQIVQPGQNCWRVERAERFYCIQDAADHFRLVRQAILQARDTVFILGWDIQATLDLLPDGASADDSADSAGNTDNAPTRLNELLKWVVRRRPGLRCYVLVWDHAALYTIERDPFTRWRLGWRMPRQVRFSFDDHHPVGGSHHQKIVVVDDELAFCGGVDLTGHRWDTPAHRVDEPARLNANGTPYEPYHEVQAMVDEACAASLGALARDRWRALGETPRPPRSRGSNDRRDLWPEGIEPDLTGVDVAIARTMPASERDPEFRECERLFLDSIAAAERSIYIESQYFSNDMLAQALVERLRQPDGPEVIAVIPKECHGWIEQQTMGALRDQVLRHLVEGDRHRRLRLVYPAASRARGVSTFVHSKVMIVDDRLVRIGSANLSRRSMGVDTECDLAADAGTDRRHRAGVQRIRDRLIGEHLGMSADDVAVEVARLGSLRALVDARADADRTLLPVDTSHPTEPPAEIVAAVADPDRPIGADVAAGAGMTELIPPLDARADRSSLRWWLPAIATGIALLAAVRVAIDAEGSGAASVASVLTGAPQMASVFWIGVAAFLLAQIALIPLEVIVVLSAIMLGGVTGGIVALAGACIAAVTGYLAGRVIGTARLASWMSRRAYRSARQLGARGIMGVAVLRMTSIASAGSVSLICGAAKTPFASYLMGSILGLLPAIIVLSAVGSLIRSALVSPAWSHAFFAAAGLLGVCVLAFAVRSLLLMRQFSPSERRHRERAEFG